jgi:benzoylformate decarboxylase
VIAPVAEACAALAEQVSARNGTPPPGMRRPPKAEPPATGNPLAPAHVLDALAERLAPDTVLVEETPSSQPEVYQRIPIRSPLGFIGTANGCLGFGLAGSIGLRMGLPERPVVAILGDGSAMYAIQGLWSAAHYGTGVLLIVMRNGAYAIMDTLAEAHGGSAPWPAFDLDMAGFAEKFGCEATRVATYHELTNALDRLLPDLAGAQRPHLLEVTVSRSKDM